MTRRGSADRGVRAMDARDSADGPDCPGGSAACAGARRRFRPMITPGDELPLHQTAEPIAFSGTDRNFYDRSWFGGFARDLVFELSFGVYPHLNIADAHFAVLRDGVQECVHASRHLGMDRLQMQVGPIAIEIVEHLVRLRLHVDP